MPTPAKPLVLAAKHANLVAGTVVTYRNLTRQGKITVEGSGGEAVGNGLDWENDDVISIEVKGKYNESAEITASKGSAKNVFSSMSEDTSTPGINL